MKIRVKEEFESKGLLQFFSSSKQHIDFENAPNCGKHERKYEVTIQLLGNK